VVVTSTLIDAHDGSAVNAEAQVARQQSSGPDSGSFKAEDAEVAKELVRLRSQFDQKATELDRERRRFAEAISELKSQREAERYEIAELQAKVQKSKEGESERKTQAVPPRQGSSFSTNQILNDLVHINDENASYRINAEGTLVLNNRYLVSGRPISSENYDINYWASCLIEVKNTTTGEMVRRTVFKKGVPQALTVGEASANLILSVTPDLSSGCLFATSR
jgi:hypothetical protein